MPSHLSTRSVVRTSPNPRDGGRDGSRAKIALVAQFSDDQRKHLEFVQAVITRMSASSGAVKGWAVALAVAADGAVNAAAVSEVALVGMVAVILLGVLDARYLTLERRFRALYDRIRRGKVESYDMTVQATDARLARVVWSWAVLGFYGAVLLVGAVAFVSVLAR